MQLATATQFRNELRRTSVTALPLILIAPSASANGYPLLPNILRAACRNVRRRSLLSWRKSDLRSSGMLRSTTGSKLLTFRDNLTSQNSEDLSLIAVTRPSHRTGQSRHWSGSRGCRTEHDGVHRAVCRCVTKIFRRSCRTPGGTRWRTWSRHCATSWKVAGLIFIGLILPAEQWSWVDSVFNRNEHQEYFWGGGFDRCVWLATLPPSCAGCLEIREPEPPGTLSRPVVKLLYLYWETHLRYACVP